MGRNSERREAAIRNDGSKATRKADVAAGGYAGVGAMLRARKRKDRSVTTRGVRLSRIIVGELG